jgi:tRNA (cytidine/uridine-2'-O-)-methyltransferase
VVASLERLRAKGAERPFHVLLVEPEIPPNTGNVARLCAATGCPLHLIGPLGFRIDEHAVRRAGLDYWHLVELHQHRTLEEAERNIGAASYRSPRGRTFLFSGKARRSYLDAGFEPGDRLVFGRESVGLPEPLLAAREAETIGIPLLGAVRSLNLANVVAIALYEALRQCGLLSAAELSER